ncbi:pentatricopeptide repeat-containing protein At2g38420, mitochondrial [Diospyros lotus]|uniref:pentatricopeptide repeat-containing protein At2g38420, mitochondrial n=1 Tax=Diospyros lotus TaxID=55363 RepID=UPI002259F5DA|nr:pentatricopeptide repeat-containing protein At2g38420, mitochondrial [Diospyros lotus]
MLRRISAGEMRKRALTLLRPPTPSNSAQACFFRSSSSSSSSRNAQNYRLRKRRKWPLSPYKAKWHENFDHKQAMQALKQSAIVSSSTTTTHLLSSLIDSFAAYNCNPTPDAYHFVIRTLAKSSKWDQIPPVLGRLETVENFETPEFIFVDLIRMYGDSSMIQHAIDLFFRIPSFRCAPSVDSLNSLLLVLCKNREGVMIVPQILLKSQLMSIRVEESSFRIMIKALCRIRQVGYAIKLLNFTVSDGNCDLDQGLCSMILSTLCEGKDLSGVDLMRFFQDMRKLGFYPKSVDWCNVIRFLVKKGRGEQAFETLKKMKVAGIKPDAVCYTLVMDGAVAEGRFERADQLLDEMLVLGLVPDIHTYNVYINSLCKQGKVEEGFKMLACMEELGCKPVVVTYNVLLQGFCKSSRLNRAMEIVKEMESKGMQLGSETYGIVIDGLVKAGEIDEASCRLREILDKGVFPVSSTLDIVICEFCQKGLASKAVELLKETIGKKVAPGIRAWEALLASEFNSMGAEIPIETGIIGLADLKMRA